MNLDEIAEVIRSSDDSTAARARLISVFDLSELQAEYILELRLRRLTKSSRLGPEAEADELRAAIAELEAVSASTGKLHGVVRHELQDTATVLSSPHRTLLLEEGSTTVAATEDDLTSVVGVTLTSRVLLEVTDEPCWIVWSATGETARIDVFVSFERPAGIPIVGSYETRTRGVSEVVASNGFVVRLNALALPPVKTVTGDEGMTWSLEGTPPLAVAVSLEEGETVVGILSLDEDEIMDIITESGVIKRTRPDYPSTQNRFPITNLDDTGQVVFTGTAGDDAQFVLVSTDAQLLRTPANVVRPQGHNTGGVAGMSLYPDAKVLAGAALPELEVALIVVATMATVTNAVSSVNQSSMKFMPPDRYPIRGRGGQSVRTQRFSKDEYALGKVFVGQDLAVALGGCSEPVISPPLGERRDVSGNALKSQIVALD